MRKILRWISILVTLMLVLSLVGCPDPNNEGTMSGGGESGVVTPTGGGGSTTSGSGSGGNNNPAVTYYTVTFNTDGGSTVESQTVASGGTVTRPATDPTKTGYSFLGWYYNGSPYDFSTTVTGTMEITAQWQINTYTVTFNPDNDGQTNSQTVEYGSTATRPTTNPTKTGNRTSYAFLGWYNGNNLYDFSALVTGNLTLTAMWLEGFVKVNGATVSGSVSSSSVFIANRSVTIPTMYVCDHEVTQAEYGEYMTWYGDVTSNNNYKPVSNYGLGNNYPAYQVNWYEAVIYCNLRSEAEHLTPAYYMTINGEQVTSIDAWASVSGTNINKNASNKYYYNSTSNSSALNDTTTGIKCDFTANGYRLPTEAEWEYIARGGNNGIPSTQYTYSGSNTIGDVAWYGNSNDKTHEVKQKSANTLGIYDMSGNVWEWCYDWYGSISASTPATGAASGSGRVLCGGSWYNVDASSCAVTCRSSYYPYLRYNYSGFRVFRSAD